MVNFLLGHIARVILDKLDKLKERKKKFTDLEMFFKKFLKKTTDFGLIWSFLILQLLWWWHDNPQRLSSDAEMNSTRRSHSPVLPRIQTHTFSHLLNGTNLYSQHNELSRYRAEHTSFLPKEILFWHHQSLSYPDTKSRSSPRNLHLLYTLNWVKYKLLWLD